MTLFYFSFNSTPRTCETKRWNKSKVGGAIAYHTARFICQSLANQHGGEKWHNEPALRSNAAMIYSRPNSICMRRFLLSSAISLL